jgi:hypothetical protein
MSTELFQILAVVLLAVVAALLALVLGALGHVRKAIIEARPSASPQSATGRSVALTGEQAVAPVGTTPRVAEAASPRAAQEPGASASPGGGERASSTGDELTVETGAASRTAAEEPQPSSHGAQATDDELSIEDDEPQEQPFERDGRWWFRRGDELLVYEEQTGQWMPAPGGGQSSSASASASAEQEAAWSASTQVRTATLSEPSRGSVEASGSFWKCPSCGAVNGSTATSCRMCFSARP